AVPPVAGGDGGECRVLEVPTPEAVEGRGKARDRRGDDDPAPPTHATGLGECLQPLGALWQVVEGSEKEHGVGARIRQSERTRVAHLGTGERHATPTV